MSTFFKVRKYSQISMQKRAFLIVFSFRLVEHDLASKGMGAGFHPLKQKSHPFRWPLGAENETRTRDPDLGKVVLYQLSYFRSISKTRSFRTGLQRYGKNSNLQIFLWFFRFLDSACGLARNDKGQPKGFARNDRRPAKGLRSKGSRRRKSLQ